MVEGTTIKACYQQVSERLSVGQTQLYAWVKAGESKGEPLRPTRQGDRWVLSDRQLEVLTAIRAHLDKGAALATFEPPETPPEMQPENPGALAQQEAAPLNQEAETVKVEAIANDLYAGAYEIAAGLKIAQIRLAASIPEESLPTHLQERIEQERRAAIPKPRGESLEAIAEKFLRAWTNCSRSNAPS